MSENYLRGQLVFKGERGFSAYEVAVQNGFVGSEKDWLTQLGTSVLFSEDSAVHTATAGQTSFDLPEAYVSGSVVNMYVDGSKLNTNQYTIDTDKINLVGVTLNGGEIVEIVVKQMRCRQDNN